MRGISRVKIYHILLKIQRRATPASEWCRYSMWSHRIGFEVIFGDIWESVVTYDQRARTSRAIDVGKDLWYIHKMQLQTNNKSKFSECQLFRFYIYNEWILTVVRVHLDPKYDYFRSPNFATCDVYLSNRETIYNNFFLLDFTLHLTPLNKLAENPLLPIEECWRIVSCVRFGHICIEVAQLNVDCLSAF
jgi:hypothetical protein